MGKRAVLIIFERLGVLSTIYNEILDELWRNHWRKALILLADIFLTPQDNLDKLREISNALKATAIEPSFALLAETQEELETVNTRMREILFT